MKIYATGMNPADSNALKRPPRVAIFQAFVEMMNVMKQNGEQFTWKATKVGTPLPPDTDAVIVSVLLPRSLNCPYALGAMWAMSEALRLEIPLVLYLTDWQFFKARSEFRSIAKAGVPYFSKTIGGALQYNEDPAMIAKHGDQLVDLCRQYDSPGSLLWQRAEVAVPRYTNWGDVKIVQRHIPGTHPVHTMDPSPLFVEYLQKAKRHSVQLSMAVREKKWLLPSLLKDNTWIERQGLNWPVERMGPKGFEVAPSESAVHDVYRGFAGALCTPYPTAGSGWWRSRWIHSALAGCVLLADSADQLEVGDEYHFFGSIYESMSNERLTDVARQQTARMMSLLQLEPEVLKHQIYQPFKDAGA